MLINWNITDIHPDFLIEDEVKIITMISRQLFFAEWLFYECDCDIICPK